MNELEYLSSLNDSINYNYMDSDSNELFEDFNLFPEFNSTNNGLEHEKDHSNTNSSDDQKKDENKEEVILSPSHQNNSPPKSKSQIKEVIEQPNETRRSVRTSLASLSYDEENFLRTIYQIFTNKKKLNKNFIIQVHNKFLTKGLNYKNMTRDEQRCLITYVKNYYSKEKEITKYLLDHKNEIISEYFLNND